MAVTLYSFRRHRYAKRNSRPLLPMFRGLFGSACLLHTTVRCAKTAEPIEMPLGVHHPMGSRNHLLVGSLDPPREFTDFVGGDIVKYREYRGSAKVIR